MISHTRHNPVQQMLPCHVPGRARLTWTWRAQPAAGAAAGTAGAPDPNLTAGALHIRAAKPLAAAAAAVAEAAAALGPEHPAEPIADDSGTAPQYLAQKLDPGPACTGDAAPGRGSQDEGRRKGAAPQRAPHLQAPPPVARYTL